MADCFQTEPIQTNAPQCLHGQGPYTGVLRKCTLIKESTIGCELCQYLIAYCADGKIYWETLKEPKGILPEGKILRVYTQPDRPAWCTIKLHEMLEGDEFQARFDEAQQTGILSVEIPAEKLKKKHMRQLIREMILFEILFTVIGIALLVFSVQPPDISWTFVITGVLFTLVGLFLAYLYLREMSRETAFWKDMLP